MISLVFTLDYEIYGNGKGSLRELVIDPTSRLAELFERHATRFVVFVEAIEFSRIEKAHSDPAIDDVRRQLRSLRAAGHEIALHLHPWWANARYQSGEWIPDWRERNLCALSPARVGQIVSEAIDYLRTVLGEPGFTPVSFRGGLWLMQPTRVMAGVLAQHGMQIDSSVFKGGRIHALGLDYRPAVLNGDSWRFSQDVNVPDPSGALLEVPIHTELVPFWEMLGPKRLRLQKRAPAAANGSPLPRRWRDFLRLRYPRKLDFCRMTADEMRAVLTRELNRHAGQTRRAPVVAIGHSKDLVDFDAIERVLAFIEKKTIGVSTLAPLLAN